MVSLRLAVALIVILAVLVATASAAYKKPPFNGSIFGKRSSTVSDYDVMNRALSQMCEAASETCNAWFSRQDAK